MIRNTFMELHQTIQSLLDIPGAVSNSLPHNQDQDAPQLQPHQPQTYDSQADNAHRRALRRIDRLLSSLAEARLEDLMEIVPENDTAPMMMPIENGEQEMGDMLTDRHEVQQSDPSVSEALEILKNDLVAVTHALVIPQDDETKRELAESCISSAAQIIVSFGFVLSTEDIVDILNRLILSGLDDDHGLIPGYLLWVINTQFENGVEIKSKSVAVLASFEILEIVMREVSEDCLAEDVNSTKRSWCTLTAFMLKFSMPEGMSSSETSDFRLWLMERMSEGDIEGSIDDMASFWMSNALQFILFISNLSLDALDMSDKYAICYSTIATQTLACYGTLFGEDLQPTVCRLWTTLVSSYLNKDSDIVEAPLQRSVASLALDVFPIVQKPDQSTTILMYFRAVEFPELVSEVDNLISLIPNRALQCVLMTMMRQGTTQKWLIDRMLVFLESSLTKGDLMDNFFWREVESYRLANEDVETV